MRPGRLLLTAVDALAVIGVLVARPVLLPAELLATFSLLANTLLPSGGDRRLRLPSRGHGRSSLRFSRDERPSLPSRGDRRPRPWWLSGAVAVLVAGTALTLPAAPEGGARWQMLTPRITRAGLWRTQPENLIPAAADLIFVLLAFLRRADPHWGARGRCVAAGARLLPGARLSAAVLAGLARRGC